MDKLKATLQMITENYVDSVDPDELVSDLITMLIGQLDQHSTYLTAEQRELCIRDSWSKVCLSLQWSLLHPPKEEKLWKAWEKSEMISRMW